MSISIKILVEHRWWKTVVAQKVTRDSRVRDVRMATSVFLMDVEVWDDVSVVTVMAMLTLVIQTLADAWYVLVCRN